MAKLIFNLRDVPIDEVLEVKQLLDDHDIDTYETSSGLFGLSVAGLWLVDVDNYDTVRKLLEDYATERQQRIRLVQGDKDQKWWDTLRRSPFRWLAIIVSVLAVTYLSIWPFINVGSNS